MDADSFIRARPVLFHVTRASAWPSIRDHGLLCTSELLLRAGVSTSAQRMEVRGARLRGPYPLQVPELGPVVLRDQKPLIRAGLEKALRNTGLQDQQWVDLLNDHVYFTCTQKHRKTLPQSTEHAANPDLLLELDTRLLLEHYGGQVRLCTFNPGYALRNPKPRRTSSFQPLHCFSEGIARVKEVAIRGSVIDITKYLRTVQPIR